MAIQLRWRYTPQANMAEASALAAIVGPRGLGIASSAYNESTGILTITYTDATTETLDLSGTFTARDAAIAAQAAAEAAQTAAETAESNAATSETNAAASASAASTSATNAAASETAAASSETAAAASESAAATSETNAATSASAASTSATAAATSATNAATSETNAAASASAASTSETNAAASETAAAASETAAGLSETAAAASATAAAASALDAAENAMPDGGEILFPVADPIPTGWYDTKSRLLSGASERAILSNDVTWNYAANLLRPSLVLDASSGTYLVDRQTENFADVFTHSRASGATYLDSTGTLQTAASGVLRDNAYAYVDGVLTGPYIQLESAAATNLLHNTDALVTQTEAVTAQPYTLHFTGTGTVTLSGASTAGPLVGTGAGENNRVSLTFTPTAGTLTLTVSGTVTDAQLEAGSIPTSYIPNLAASGSVSRAAETLTIDNPPWPATITGTELVTNGGFDTDSDWTKGTGWTISGGVASSDGTQTARSSLFQSSLTVGKLCHFSMTVSNYVSGNVRLRNGIGATETYITDKGENGTFTAISRVGSSGGNITLVVDADADFVGSIDNISIKEITPRGLAIDMDGLVTYADTGIDVAVDGLTGEVMFASWRVDSSNYIANGLSTGGAQNGQPVFVQEASGVFDFVNPAGSTYSPGINVPFSIASRHGDNFINGAVDGTALTADLTPTILPDLSSTSIQIGSTFNGYIKSLRIWDVDIGDAGIEDASS